MNNRIYNKLYVNKNRESASENLVFGYQHDQREIVFKKNQETYFHIPAYTNSIKLVDTNLIANGASAGAFPAASDRIFKSRKNYGDRTQHGSPTDVADGTWFCSWLYKNPNTGVIQWMDRFYNPGKFDYSIAKAQLLDYPPYVRLDPIFKDKPSRMSFEPGVLYRYFHYGEQSFDKLLTTFEGASSERIALHLLNWGQEQIDRSSNNTKVVLNTTALSSQVFPSVNETGRILNPVIGFNHTSNVECFIDYNSSYTPTNEFTWTLWTQSDNWQDNVSTQILGNFSSQGGVGVFIDTLETYPFITIPETTYGHVLMINQDGYGFMDKTLQKNFSPVNPVCFAVDSNDHVLVCNNDTAGVIYKMDHAGKILRSTKNISDLSTLFAFSLSGELPKQVLCGRNDDFYVVTSNTVYVFDNNLQLKQTVPQPIKANTIAAFSYDSKLDTDELVLTPDVKDVKFIESTKWSIGLDGKLYKDSELFETFIGEATTFSVAPDGNIWVLHGTNRISVLNPSLAPGNSVIKLFAVGTDVTRTAAKKNVSFIKKYNRLTNTKTWYSAIFYSDEKQLYFHTLDGLLDSIADLTVLGDTSIVKRYKQKVSSFNFTSQGDFTGYERKRIFNTLSPYNNKPQIVIKTSVKDLSKDSLFYTVFKKHHPIDQWNSNSWQHLVLTYKNKGFQLWANSVNVVSLTIGGQYEVSYDMQPAFYIGSPVGSSLGLNSEIKHLTSIFNGKIGDVRIYDYQLPHSNIETYIKASVITEDLYWPMSIPTTQYVEQVERVFKHKMPGAKSQFFNIKLNGTGVTDAFARQIIEEELRQIVSELKPLHTDLLKIEWT